MKSRIALVIALLALAVSAMACDRVEQAVAPEPEVVTQEATVAVAAAAVDGELPKGMPEVIPLWPGASVSGGEVTDGAIVLSLETSEPYADVLAGTSVGFERAGWSVAEGAEEASATALDVAGEGYEGIVTVTGTDEITKIDYLLSQTVE